VVRARQGRGAEAERLLTRASERGDRETRAGSLVMLGGLLLERGALERGGAILADAIALCEGAGDAFHLAFALFNRIEAWRRLGQPARATADCERAIEIAHEMGYHQIETWGYINLADVFVWSGRLPDATDAARRAHELDRKRFGGRPVVVAALRYAYLLAHSGQLADAAAIRATIRRDDVDANPWLSLLYRAVELATRQATPAEWRLLVHGAREASDPRDLLDALWLRGRVALAAGDHATATRALADALGVARRTGGATAPMLALLAADHQRAQTGRPPGVRLASSA
jgi:tetratricopeptide (TPR) repeat protein